MRPSFIYHQITALLEIVGTVLSLFYIYKNCDGDLFKISILILFLALVWGIHSIIHFWEEIYYDYNPLIGDSKVYDKPIK